MPKYLITGSPGAGKTSTIEELKRRGYTAFNTDDEPGVTAFYELATNKKLDKAPPAPIDFSKYDWCWDVTALKELLAKDETVFVGAITGNTLENLGLFDGVFVPHPSLTEIERRILTRTNNDFGKHPEELAGILREHRGADDFWRSKGAIIIDGDQPLTKVVDDILKHVGNDNR